MTVSPALKQISVKETFLFFNLILDNFFLWTELIGRKAQRIKNFLLVVPTVKSHNIPGISLGFSTGIFYHGQIFAGFSSD